MSVPACVFSNTISRPEILGAMLDSIIQFISLRVTNCEQELIFLISSFIPLSGTNDDYHLQFVSPTNYTHDAAWVHAIFDVLILVLNLHIILFEIDANLIWLQFVLLVTNKIQLTSIFYIRLSILCCFAYQFWESTFPL